MKKLGFIIIEVLIIGVFFLQSSVSIAVTKTELNNSQSETDKKIEEAKEELEGIKNEKSETLQEVEKLTTQISEYQNQIDTLDNQIFELNGKIEEAQTNLNKAQEDYQKQEELLEARLVATYEAGETSYLDFILSSGSITELISNYYLVTEIANNDAELLDNIKKQKEEIEKAKETLENSKRELDTSKASKQSVATQLKASKSQKDSYVAKLSEDEKQTQAELEQFETDKRAIQLELAKIAKQEEEERKKQETSKGGSTSPKPPVINNPSSSGYIKPVSGYSITCGWYGYARHTGVDFSGSGISGKPVLAVKSGTVTTSTALKNPDGTYRSYGEYIVINHHDGTMTLYAHGAPGSRLVSPGQSVSQGQQIMSVGTTGNSTGYHLHFEVWLNGTRVNPTPYLP